MTDAPTVAPASYLGNKHDNIKQQLEGKGIGGPPNGAIDSNAQPPVSPRRPGMTSFLW
jgi:hypothetical protein